MPKQKVYVIVHDGEFLLVGSGGTSGKNLNERKGLHLPGGSKNDNEGDEVTASRELEEETGIKLEIPQGTQSVKVPDIGDAVFVVVKVDNVDELVGKFVRPNAPTPQDEPFKALHSKSLKECIDKDLFCTDDLTDWFKLGLLAANKQGLLK